jgi:rRNA maturation endonuclease Nob1
MMATLTDDIAALAKDQRVMWAVKVLRDRGINGVMYDKLIALAKPWPGHCQTCFAALTPPNRQDCPSCGADDWDDD